MKKTTTNKKQNRFIASALLMTTLMFVISGKSFGQTKTFIGVFDWYQGSSWSPFGVPTAANDVIINSTNIPILNNGAAIAQCNNLTINTGGTMECRSSIQVSGNLTINGTLKFNNTGSLKLIGTASGTGNVEMLQNANNMGSNLYHYWSSPFTNTNMNTAVPGSLYYTWNGSSWSSAGGTMATARGYAIYNSSSFSQTTTVSNTRFTGTVSTPTTGGAGGFTLVGNPYPCTIDASSVISGNVITTTGSLYFWSDDGSAGNGYATGDYAVRNNLGGLPANGLTPSNKISKCQGFFVQNTGTPGVVAFDPPMQLTYVVPHPVFFSNNNELVWLKGVMGTAKTQTLFGFSSGATDAVDWGYDAEKFFGPSAIGIYTMMGNTAYTINAMAPSTGYKEIDLGVYAPNGQTLQISLDSTENFDAANTIYLYDGLTGTYTDIRNGSYAYTGTGVQENNRFKVIINPVITGLAQTSTTLLQAEVYPNPSSNGIFTLITNEECFVSVTDVLGKEVLKQRLTNQNNQLNLQAFDKGVYHVNITRSGQSQIIRIIKSN